MMNYFKTAAVAATLAFGSVTGASAATLIEDGNTYSIGVGSEFFGNVKSTGGAGEWKVLFDSVVDPLLATASATIGNIVSGEFQGLVMSWVSDFDDFVLASTSVIPLKTELATTFTTCGVQSTDEFCFDDSKQWLVLSWSDSSVGAGFDVEVSAVPLPAGGVLLVTALGGLGLAARRRKA